MTTLNRSRSGTCLCSFTASILPYPVFYDLNLTPQGSVKITYGKITDCMNAEEPILTATPPRLFRTLLNGFNTVAGQIHLILLPVLIDLFLWLGPKLRIHDLFSPFISGLTDTMTRVGSKEMLDTIKMSTELWTGFLEQFNLLTAIRTIPIGVPSLIARLSPNTSPLKTNLVLETPSLQVGVAMLGLLLMTGFFLGAVYFNSIARYSAVEKEKFSWSRLFWQYSQSLVFFLILVAILIAISIPMLILISLLGLLSLGLAQFVLMGFVFLLLWGILPLVFSPHGIFTLGQRVVPSMLLSLRLVRFFLPGTGFFILFSVLVSEGFNMLWMLPSSDSWLTLLGIGGHAFIVTGLMVASFRYYREGLRWMQFNIQKISEAKRQQESGGSTLEQ